MKENYSENKNDSDYILLNILLYILLNILLFCIIYMWSQ